ncbi:RimK/LysX family protein [Aestuariibacter sp. AA17]|uniref:RimK/LysX family protein n=1 Tax=Fluctibacter corallii TaxID=2984329 RepID=A0ABT3A662_9ALTE|nr:RimK/LysX family protein [Aestuariibacter sp. AA17]MCV2884098.1 RimK/LysX family protein [Aestuariibacter sp. AA17]
MSQKIMVGVVESIALPSLKLANIATRIDTGAKTSALHVDHIVVDDAQRIVHFEFHPDFHDIKKTIKCSAPLHDRRWIKSSNGEREQRCVIKTQATLGASLSWDIEITLTDRSSMNHLMLLGREAMEGVVIVDPEAHFLASERSPEPDPE